MCGVGALDGEVVRVPYCGQENTRKSLYKVMWHRTAARVEGGRRGLLGTGNKICCSDNNQEFGLAQTHDCAHLF